MQSPSSTSCVTLAGLPAPAASSNLSGPQIAATSNSGIAAPVDSGVDQAPLSVVVLDTDSQPVADRVIRSYQRIYYRQSSTNALVTNLFPADGDVNSFLGISPYAGAYPNNGSAGGGQPATFDGFHYVATTSTIDQKITGYLAINASPPRVQQPDRGARRDHRPRQQHHVGRQRHLADRVRRLHPQHLPARPDQHQHRDQRP